VNCLHIKPDGTTCQAAPTASGYCFFHDPNKAQARRAAGAKGGRHNKKPAPAPLTFTGDVMFACVADVMKVLGETATEVRRDSLDTKRANALGYLASIALRGLVANDFEARLLKLEEMAAKRELGEQDQVEQA